MRALVVLIAFVGALVMMYLVVSNSYVSELVFVTDGVMIDDPVEADLYIEALSSAGIPFDYHEADGKHVLSWDEEYARRVEAIELKLLGGREQTEAGLCFSSEEERAILSKLMDEASLAYRFGWKQDDLKCMFWKNEIDDRVQEIYPNLREIRDLEARRLSSD